MCPQNPIWKLHNILINYESGAQMELSKEQINLLKQVKNETVDIDYYYNNPVFGELITVHELVNPHLVWSDEHRGLVPDGFMLTAKGQTELSKALEKKHRRWNDNFLFPIISNAISAIIGIIIGAIATYLNMK